ncbi:MAG: chaperone ClpB [Candidatus Paraimprobicoccus trichonymphae]|uniref:Chaperone ClpB n=1 Tax=Candidatus Paraimprobicoccus trichonymphae TaxID=3033793 RepID=A0AA48IH80_9FIRM|nr:MAG: chaperone ClpB [Candidatus Paraimprobicoccus trichonymphae]
MLCHKCKKKPAVIFVSTDKNMSKTQGYCLTCAQELGIKPVDQILKTMGLEEDFNSIQEQLEEMIENGSEEVESHGGAITFPFVKNLFSELRSSLGSSSAEDETTTNNKSKSYENNKKEINNNFKKIKRKFLDVYCVNLNKNALNKEIDLVVGREFEIERIIQILSRRTKNNPCLVGEPGVGKTAIAEALALRIVNNQVPFKLKNKEIYLLDLTSLVAGTQFRGQFENRIKNLIEEIKKDGNIILFIDEIHSLVGAGDSEGSMNAANILKPALSRGKIQVIGATTFNEYRKYIEKDSAFERRFQQVKVLEPNVEKTKDILKGIKNYYENYHRVLVSDDIVNRIVVLSERYITERFLPDKAIDLLDESCAHTALKNKKLEEYDRLSSEIEKLKSEQENLVTPEEKKDVDFRYLTEIKYNLNKLGKKYSNLKKSVLNNYVTEQDVSEVIEIWTGIPATRIQENEFKKLENLEDNLKSKIIGQDKVIKKIVTAIKRNRVQINPRRCPASFIFIGYTGVGKTELVKILSAELFDNPDTLIKVDMSEFMEKHSVSRIIGTPPGYVGYDESGQITEKVRQKPYSVVLFDEIEKAHPDVMNILLQVLDEGKITDSHGRTVNFENTIIIMTSNAGSNNKDLVGFGKNQNELTKEKALKAISEFLRPEFISRVDEIVVFNKLTEKDFVKIAELILQEYKKILEERNINLEYDSKSTKFLAEKAIKDNKNGARDLRNLTRREVEDFIASEIVKIGGFNIKNISLTCKNSKLKIDID